MIKAIRNLTTDMMVITFEVMASLALIEMSIDIAGRIKKIAKGEKDD